jgi:hypothetical protein
MKKDFYYYLFFFSFFSLCFFFFLVVGAVEGVVGPGADIVEEVVGAALRAHVLLAGDEGHKIELVAVVVARVRAEATNDALIRVGNNDDGVLLGSAVPSLDIPLQLRAESVKVLPGITETSGTRLDLSALKTKRKIGANALHYIS